MPYCVVLLACIRPNGSKVHVLLKACAKYFFFHELRLGEEEEEDNEDVVVVHVVAPPKYLH